MGSSHARTILSGNVENAELAAVCDSDASRAQQFPGIRHFLEVGDMIASGTIDAVIIATPHYGHVPVGVAALGAGLHVLVEKPLSVTSAECDRFIAARKSPKQVIAIMFNQRTDPWFARIRNMVQGGEFGRIVRMNWTVTDWFRPNVYYASATWRGTWNGEGGGVLVNQCPHNLDLLQWIFGMPKSVRAFCHFGKYHAIEVEDEVTAYLEFESGATGIFVTSTGEAPGTNRLEIAGDKGRLIYENGKLVFVRNEIATSEFSRTTKDLFAPPPSSASEITCPDHGGQHRAILQNFVAAIVGGEALFAQAEEGKRSVELANAMLLSTWTGQTINFPIDAGLFTKTLRQRCEESAARSPKRA
jgi:predicted dehydrogenase